MKKLIFLGFFTILIFCRGASGYDNLVIHPRLARQATEVYNQASSKQLSFDQINWIVAGAVKEDADPRYVHHFYDYRTGAGFGVWSSADKWSQIQDSVSGDYSEKAILSAYREGNEKLAYVGVGHQLHIIEDMAVPAHVRNDPHDPDPYENWCQKNSPVLPLANLIEVTNIPSAIINFAKSTGNNFYSYDRLDGGIKYDKTVIENKIEYTSRNGNKLSVIKRTFNGDVLDMNDFVHQDYFTQLAPKAVGYSAGVIDYFQKKFAKIDEEKNNKSVSFLDKLYQAYIGQFKEVAVVIGDTVNAFSMDRQLASNPTVQTELANNPQLVADIKIATTPTIPLASTTFAKIIKKTTTTIKATLTKKTVLGEKITFAGQQVPTNKPAPTAPTDGNNVTFTLVTPVQAETIINPALGTPLRTSPIPTYGAPVNSEPINIPDPIIYPGTEITSQPPATGSSTLAFFEFDSDYASSSYEYQLDVVGTSTEWHVASSTLSLDSLIDGQHSIKVRAIFKAVPDQTPAEFAWTIDSTPPASQLTSLENYSYSKTLTLSWSRIDPDDDEIAYDLDYQINAGNWQTLVIATTTMTTVIDQPLQNGDTVGFRLRACDALGNCESVSTTSQTATRIRPGHLVISAIQTSGGTAKDEWIELYNPTINDISLTTYELKRKSSNGLPYNLVANFGSAIIKAQGYYLITHSVDYDSQVIADKYYGSASYAISDDNTVLLIEGSTTIDKVGFGNATDTEALSSTNLASHQVAVRKSDYAGHTVWQGNDRDTDNNREDFVTSDSYVPHSSDSVTEPRDEAPAISNAANLTIATSDATTATLSWLSMDNANLGAGARYEIKYQATTGTCALNKNWRSLANATSTPEPSITTGNTEQYIIKDLSPGTTYYVAIRNYNGTAWSVLSNQLSFRTACNDLAPRATNYTTHLTKASTSTVPNQTPESILVVDYISDVLFGIYDIYGASTCGPANAATLGFSDPASTLTRIEFVYDPVTLLFTGQRRACENGWRYLVQTEGDHCRDLSNGWNNSRWTISTSLIGQPAVALKRRSTGQFTEWLRPN